MGDVTRRVTEILTSVDLIACEDTRVSGSLLKKLGIKNKLVSYHEFNERKRAEQLLNALSHGQSIAVISDAGSPGISDPAYRVVRVAIENNIEVIALPGPNAIIPALTASGLPTDRFFFEGFLSHRSAARRKRLECLADMPHTLIFYESPHRIVKCVADMLDILGDRPVCLSREISKKFEEHLRGSLSYLLESLTSRPRKGEMVIVVGGKTESKGNKKEDDDE